MMKKKKMSLLAGLLTFCMLPNTLVFAADTNATTSDMAVSIGIAPSFTVSIPQTISGNVDADTTYTIGVSGDLGASDTVTVKPTSKELRIYNVEDQTLQKTVTLSYEEADTVWDYKEAAADTKKQGKILAPTDLTAGDWRGRLMFSITYTSEDDVVEEVIDTFTAENAYCTISRKASNYMLTVSGSGTLPAPALTTEQASAGYEFWYQGKLADYSRLDVTIEAGVTGLGDNYFRNCGTGDLNSVALKKVTLPSSLTTLGTAAFKLTRNLEEINLENVTSLSNECFRFSGIKAVTLNDNMEEIPYYAFGNTPALQSIHLPENLKTIGELAFSNCAVEELHIPASVTTLETNCFQNVKKVVLHNKDLTIPEDKWGAVEVVYAEE